MSNTLDGINTLARSSTFSVPSGIRTGNCSTMGVPGGAGVMNRAFTQPCPTPQINEKAGMTFGAALRSILRQDPDIIMVGEMRDTETAEIAIRAAITGHLVLSTLHTNDAASTVTRLVDMGVEAYMVATSLIGIVAQRLTKVLCPECKKPRMSTEEENELMGLDHSVQVYDPCGCPKCNNTGYKGRTAIHEILLATPSMQALITRGAKADEIQELAKKEGCHLLRDNVSELVQQGKTSMDELIRVTYAV